MPTAKDPNTKVPASVVPTFKDPVTEKVPEVVIPEVVIPEVEIPEVVGEDVSRSPMFWFVLIMAAVILGGIIALQAFIIYRNLKRTRLAEAAKKEV